VTWLLTRLLQEARADAAWPADAQVIDGYVELTGSAPRRNRPFLVGHAGITGVIDGRDRGHGHLIVGLCNASHAGQHPVLPDGGRLRLVDYNVPLHSRRAERALGEIDLLGLLEDQTLAVIAAHMDPAGETLRASLLRLLVGMAVLEANVETIAGEAEAVMGCRVLPSRPRGLLMAGPAQWERAAADGSLTALQHLCGAIAAEIGIDVRCLTLDDARPALDAAGARPWVRGHKMLRIVPGQAARKWPTALPADPMQFVVEQIKAFWRHAGDEPDFVDDAGSALPVANDNTTLPPRPLPAGSLRSAQTLARALFDGAQRVGCLGVLGSLLAEDGYPALPGIATASLQHDHVVRLPGEAAPVPVDLRVIGTPEIFVDVKFTEARFGICDKPGLKATDPDFARDLCTGAYRVQNHRRSRCALTEQGGGIWHHMPALFDWDAASDLDPCPLFDAFQLARLVLAACAEPDGSIATADRHVLVIYDDRSPAFWPGGEADAQWLETVRHLRHPRLLRRVSWQAVIRHLAPEPALAGLLTELRDRYDFDDPTPPAESKPPARSAQS